MSSAFYPLGSNTYNNRLPQGGYKSWKGTGINSNPVGTTAGTLRPWSNMDYANTNNAQQIYTTYAVSPTRKTTGPRFGLPRPIKHFRKGRSVTNTVNNTGNGQFYNQRVVSSSSGTLVNQLMDFPGTYSIYDFSSQVNGDTLYKTPGQYDFVNGVLIDNFYCKLCYGIGMVSDIYPNKQYLTENPEPISETAAFCCNPEKKARRRVLPASTVVKKNYYQDLQSYRQSRCQTYDQRVFNFQTNEFQTSSVAPSSAYKPGGPLAPTDNAYFANCQPDFQAYPVAPPNPNNPNPIILIPQQGCKVVYYKPNNYQYAKQGAVSSSTRNLKLNVDTINTNLVSFNMDTLGRKLTMADVVTSGNNDVPFILKNKFPPCRQQIFINARNIQDHKSCFLQNNNSKLPLPTTIYPQVVHV